MPSLDQTVSNANSRSQPGLLRALGIGTAIAVVIGNVIGSGIFAKPGVIAAEAGDFRVILAAWVTGGILSLLGALCFAELAAMLPRAGGTYVYLREAYGRPVAFLLGWNELLVARPASMGALSVFFIGSVAQALDWKIGLFARILFTMLLIGGMAWVNTMGVIWGGRVQIVTTLIKVGFLGLVALLPVVMSWFAAYHPNLGNYLSRLPVAAGSTPASRFGVAVLAVMWAYNGWHAITQIAEEIRDPQRNIPRALLFGVSLLIVLFLSFNAALHGVLSMDRMAQAREHAAEVMVRMLLGPIGAAVMSGVILCSTFSGINSNLLLGPRIFFAMGRDGVFFPQLARVHARYRTPVVAIVVQSLMAIILVITTGVLVKFVSGLEQKSIFDMLTDFAIFAVSFFYVLGVVAVLVLRRKHPEWERPYRTWGYPIVPLLFSGFYVWFLTQIYQSKPLEANAGLILIALGIPVYYGWRGRAIQIQKEQSQSALPTGTSERERG